MFDRKETIVKNKKYLISHEYIRKLFESNNSQRNIKFKDNNNSDFKKVETIQKINISNDQPLVLFHKPNQNNNMHNLENQIKKDLVENKGYLNDGGYKKKLLKFYSYHNTDQNQSKNIFRSSYSQNKNRSKNNENFNFFNSKITSFSMALNKRTLQKDYSNSIKIRNKKSNSKYKEKKEKENKLFNSVNVKDIKYRDLLIKKLINKKSLEKNLLDSQKYKNNNKINRKEINYKRKKDYLDHNNISYSDIQIENEKNNIEINSLTDNKNRNNSKKELKNIKDIKINDKRIIGVLKKRNDNMNNFGDDNLINKNIKKRYKDVNQFEFLKKIKKELNILRKSKEKDKKSESKKN